MEVHYDYSTKSYQIKERISNGQTLFMWFQFLEETKNGAYYNVALAIYNKRKHASRNEEEKCITGLSPFETVSVALKAFRLLENEVWQNCALKNRPMNLIVNWVDNRRRDAYNRVLSKKGFYYTNYRGEKVLYKHYKPEDYVSG